MVGLLNLTNRRELYADFHKDLTLNPVNSDLARRINEEAVKESIKNLLLTNRGERLFNPNLGSNLRNIIFENLTPDVVVIIKETVRETIENYEPRCNLIEVNVTSSIDGNEVTITVVFNVINIEKPITLNVTLSRVR